MRGNPSSDTLLASQAGRIECVLTEASYTLQVMPGIEAVIWDLGGVIARTFDRSWRTKWESELGLAEYELERAVFNSAASWRAAVGQADQDQVWAEVGHTFDLEPARLADLREDFWRGDRIDEQLIDYIRGLRPQYQTGMITNAWPETRQLIEDEWQLSADFDLIVVSAEVGLAKPDPAIYELALEQLAVEPQAAVFVDDFSENVAAAQELGIQAVRFEGREQAIRELDRILGRPS